MTNLANIKTPGGKTIIIITNNMSVIFCIFSQFVAHLGLKPTLAFTEMKPGNVDSLRDFPEWLPGLSPISQAVKWQKWALQHP